MTTLLPAAVPRLRAPPAVLTLSRLAVPADPATSACRTRLAAPVARWDRVGARAPRAPPPRPPPPALTATAPDAVPVPARVPPALTVIAPVPVPAPPACSVPWFTTYAYVLL